MLVVLLLVPVAYMIGTFPTASLVARARGRDVDQEGSGNPGASNVTRLIGWQAGLLVFLADGAKGAMPAAVGLVLDGHRGAFVLGAAAMLGHIFPVTRRFRGGRGVATAAGVTLVIFPFITAVLAIVWLALARLLGKASVASLVVVVAFPVLVAVFSSAGDVITTAVLAALIVIRHTPNLRRLIRREETGLGGPAPGTVGGEGEAGP
ncbi:MAG: glycerol-3-phosphate acyltransferase [Acidimicrobiia bacterium]